MSLSVKFTVTGLDQIKSNLDGLKQSVQSFVQQEPMKIANDMVSKMQDQAPVRTGYLRDNITADEGDEEGQATVTSEADYSIYVEMGTRYMAAEPFFFPIFDQYTIQNIIDDFKQQVSL